MKVVLDTNVLISGIYFGGIPGKILEAWGARRFQLLVSTEILQEYLNVAERLADRYAGVEYESILGLIIQNAELVQPSDLPESVSRDPDDDKFLACCAPQKFMRLPLPSYIHGVIHPGQDEPQLYSGSESDADVCVV